MAAKQFYRKGFLLLLFNFISTAALEKRFSDLKRCADEECSMLLCRGKAVEDFSGPDCRFLSFKKTDTVYVYYKLSGRRTDMWAGSVGSTFGYFPKDLIAVNHVYTDKEHEVPAEETDFVCFDTGFDRFDNYDIDSLLDPSRGDDEATKVPEETEADTRPSDGEVEDEGKLLFEPYSSEDVVADDPSASLPDEEPPTEDVEEKEAVESQREESDPTQQDSDSVNSEAKEAEMKHEIEEPQHGQKKPVTVSEELQIPKLETTFGSTFDAIATDADITTKTSPNEEEEGIGQQCTDQDEAAEAGSEPRLLSFTEEQSDDSVKEPEVPPREDQELRTPEEKGMWTKLGDSVFSVVMGGERPETGGSDEDDEDEDDDDDEAVEETPLSFDELKKDKEPITGFPQGPDPVEDQGSNAVEVEDADSDSKKLLFEDDEEPPKPEEPLDEAPQPTEDNTTPQVEPDLPDSQTQVDSKVALLNDEVMDGPSPEANVGSEMIVDDNKTAVEAPEPEETEGVQVTIINDDSLIKVHEQEPDVETEANLFEFSIEETKAEDVTTDRADEELLEDENALLNSQSQKPDQDEQTDATDTESLSPGRVDTPEPPQEPEYSDSIRRLTLLWTHFSEESMTRFRKFLTLKNLYKLESMYTDLDLELQAARLSPSDTVQDVENALERILEASENTILDEIEKMLDERLKRNNDPDQDDTVDEETEILDEFQDLGFTLRQKYSTARDSTPLAEEKAEDVVQGEHNPDVNNSAVTVEEEKAAVPEVDIADIPLAVDHQERVVDTQEESVVIEDKHAPDVTTGSPASIEESLGDIPAADGGDNHTGFEETPAATQEEPVVTEEVYPTADVSMEEEGAHFNVNKQDQPHLETAEHQKVPQDTLESPLDMGLGVDVETSPSEKFNLFDAVSDIHEEEVGIWSTGFLYTGCLISMIKAKVFEWTVEMISLLPEEWKPGETLFGLPWQAVVVTALVGVFSFAVFFWRTVLTVKKKEYLVDEKRIAEQIQTLKKEKDDALQKITELQKRTEELKEDQKLSAENVNCTMKKIEELQAQILEAEAQNDRIAQEKIDYSKLLEEERENAQQNETRIQKLEKSNEKLQLNRKKVQEALAKTNALLDEAKIREEARNAQQKLLQKEYTVLKEENKTLKSTIKEWEDKHTELSDQIKVYQKSQKELEDSLVQKDHSLEVLSDLLADLEACDLQKSDSKTLANGDVAPEKKAVLQNRIKQMMDVSRVQTTLAVIEEERDRFMTKLLNEEKARKELEEKHQELEHEIGTLKSKKSHVENQLKVLQQKNEIMVEMYQQKENALQQRLTKEELERQSKESMLTEVGGKAVAAEEQVKLFRQRITEMEEQMKKTEEVYKEQIKDLENKTHSNWLKARNAERALNQEKIELSKLREKLAVVSSQLNERRAPLFRPNSGQASGLRQGDSYGPSPVSGGAPSPPIMIEGPRRPPSAPVGRRIDPYGPRPPSDPHGRYPDGKHMSGMDIPGPRSSSPTNMDSSGPGSFLASPIRDSPGPLLLDPQGRGPPPGPYRPPRPGQFHPGPLPANGHPGMPLPGPMGVELGPRPANGHTYAPRPGPMMDPRGPPPPHFRPPPPHLYRPPPPVQGVRGPMGPRAPFPPDMRFPGPPMDLPPGAVPHPAQVYSHAPPLSAGPPAGPALDRPLKQDSSQDPARPAPV
ncbi:transport and Golgi organization protein 1 homolog isoform X2 [Synchiropus splendidus]|uniref:transport and Golgi organization protein 1 homolog isoform X2 n=1 Tax=Synchiropus splendidus TaxID=270530 RepID=UPI00237E4320|nr:transport and Golgi organization protein 1 homolog isoform X2 [Synchiropus splendidus]